ncbi:hypothetical protein ACJIZ3_000175 [Penstemon smallii]|uniref:Large ribosomal subunit protein uL23cz/uL23cy n=1 Tax=Penstemon smallii TaxID=265156 RepID=A0ABD3R8A6_9LAMI
MFQMFLEILAPIGAFVSICIRIPIHGSLDFFLIHPWPHSRIVFDPIQTLHFNCIRLLGKNQYTSNVESGSTRTELKHWVELFFGVKVIAMNSHRLPGKGRRMGPIMGHTMQYRRMIITLQPGYSIPPLRKKRT